MMILADPEIAALLISFGILNLLSGFFVGRVTLGVSKPTFHRSPENSRLSNPNQPNKNRL
jgi:hypothetical protein